jgi:hypothetical protein
MSGEFVPGKSKKVFGKFETGNVFLITGVLHFLKLNGTMVAVFLYGTLIGVTPRRRKPGGGLSSRRSGDE